ncbi:hypothetical protein ACOMHN_040167 [Nucella lapillus]
MKRSSAGDGGENPPNSRLPKQPRLRLAGRPRIESGADGNGYINAPIPSTSGSNGLLDDQADLSLETKEERPVTSTPSDHLQSGNNCKSEVKTQPHIVKRGLKRAGQYLLGPRIGSSPVRSIVQVLARKEGTDEFYTLKILTLENAEKETQDDRQGKMLMHTEFCLHTSPHCAAPNHTAPHHTSPHCATPHHTAAPHCTTHPFFLNILTLENAEKETQDDRQGKMLMHTEFSLLSLLRDQDGVVHHHGLFKTLAAISTTIPVTSVPCERGFSSQNLIHTPLRNCLSIKAVENKMFIKHAAKHAKYSEQTLITDACADFMAQKPRRF